MPQIGEVKPRKQPNGKATNKHIWHACEQCGFERWVVLHHKKPKTLVCRSCANKNRRGKRMGVDASIWKGGKWKDGCGYIRVRVYTDNFFSQMGNYKGYVLEHRLIMAKYLNRCLLPWEVVHHKNGVRDDNRIENLQLLPHARFHIADSQLKGRITRLEKEVAVCKQRITLLESENVLLCNQLNRGEYGRVNF